jgi:hypothetical protein
LICFAQPSFEHATCFTCSANVRTPWNAPWVGLKVHFASGIASANDVKSISIFFHM